MNGFRLQPRGKEPATVLCLGAHCDDIEIGCGGSVARLLRANPQTQIHWVVFCSTEERQNETRKGAGMLLGESAENQISFHTFRDGFLPYVGAEVKDAFEALKTRFDPDLIFTHHRRDAHQDHRTVCELTWNTWRDHTILEYEIPKWDGDLGRPDTYIHLDEDIVSRKVGALMEAYGSQRSKRWFDEETFRSLMRLRGVESNAPGRYAEAFYSPKAIFELFA